MFNHLVSFLWQAVKDIPSALLSGGWGAIAFSAFLFLAQFGVVWLLIGKEEAKKRFFSKPILVGLVTLFYGWAILFAISIILSVYKDHERLIAENHKFRTALEHPKTREGPWLEATGAKVEMKSPLGTVGGVVIHLDNKSGVPLTVKLVVSGSRELNLNRSLPLDREYVKKLPVGSTLVGPHDQRDVLDLSYTSIPPKQATALLKNLSTGLLRLNGAFTYASPHSDEDGFTQFCFILNNGKSVGACLDNRME